MTVTVKPRLNWAFMVWRKSHKTPPPDFRHNTVEEAEADAEKLARKHPGKQILVLQEISRFRFPNSAANAPLARSDEPGGDCPPTSPGSNSIQSECAGCSPNRLTPYGPPFSAT